MKLFIVTSFLILFLGAIKANAQQITINVKNASLSHVLDEIKKQIGYSLIAKDHLMENSKPVTVAIFSQSLSYALSEVLKNQGLTFAIVNKTIVIKEADTDEKKNNSFKKGININGSVKDSTGLVLSGATVKLIGTTVQTQTDDKGNFYIEDIQPNGVLQVTFIGYQTAVVKLEPGITNYSITMYSGAAILEAVSVVSTGYQTIPKDRANGSFQILDKEILNRRVGTNILDRLNGITTGFYFKPNFTPSIATIPSNKSTGLTIRGVSTYMSSTEPLIVVDNFPYEGDINNLNPNDIDNITILKDAAAASIWGARSGNGVIVITTKRGRKNEKLKVNFNSNLTVANKPDLRRYPSSIASSDYIDVEQYLFDQGYFNTDITNKTTRPTVSPAVEIMAQLRSGTITSTQAKKQLDVLRKQDVIADYDKYVYQNAVSQQYSLGLRGGGENATYSLTAGIDNNKTSLKRNDYNRITLNSNNSYYITKNLEVSANLNYSQNKTGLNNQFALGSYTATGGKYLYLYPYARLADDNGTPLSISSGFREAYLDETAAKGFLDWRYRPLDEINMADNTSKIRDILSRVSVKYKIIPSLSAEVSYQNEWQTIENRTYRDQNSFYTRNLINKYAVYNATTQSFTYNFPLGSILSYFNYDWRANNARGQLNFHQENGKQEFTAILGTEVRELRTSGLSTTLYGYNDQFGTSNSSLNFQTTYPTNPTGSALIPSNASSVTGTLNRYISYYFNGAYCYDEKYTFSLSGRKDGANLFGAKTNDRITPLWSAGFGWEISKEKFYKASPLPYLKLRATYGFNGNTYNSGTAFLTGRYSTDGITGAQYIGSLVAPNPELKWERVKNANLGIDFALTNQQITGSIEYYRKDGKDLVQPTSIAPQTGFETYAANVASTHTAGWDIALTTKNLKGYFKWNTSLLFSIINDKVVRYDAPLTNATILSPGGVTGKPLFALFAYKWNGIDPQTGNPIGYLNGKASQDYAGIINNYQPDSLVYVGNQRPTKFGSFRNDFAYKGFQLSVNIIYKFGYVFRKPTVNLNYTAILTTGAHPDYAIRWQKPGDEKVTNVPSMTYPNNSNRNTFYQYSEVLIQSGDHIRLQDIRFSYDLPAKLLKGRSIKNIELYTYANNLGIIWRKNKFGIDPDFIGSYSTPFSLSVGITANF